MAVDTYNPSINIFGVQYTAEQLLIKQSWLESLWAEEYARMAQAQRLLDWYNHDRDAIVEYCQTLALKTFVDVTEWEWPPLNFVTRTIKRQSLAYRQRPKRTLIDRDSGEPIKPDDAAIDTYADMMSIVDIDRRMKEADRLSRLLNTIHIEVVPRNNTIDWEFRLGNSSIVIADPMDYLSFAKIAYRWEPVDPDTLEPSFGWIYWTEEEHFFVDESGRGYGMLTEDGANPYDGKIPIVVVRQLEQDDYWGRLGADLVDANESAMVQFGNAWEIALYQTHGQAFGVNVTKNDGETIKTGPKNPIFVRNVHKDMAEPKLSFISPESDVANTLELIQRYLDWDAASEGLPRSSWATDVIEESGISKYMDNVEMLENRDDGIAMWLNVERELFETSVMVYNRWAQAHGKTPMPDNVTIDVTFPDASFPESPTEAATRWTVEITGNLASIVDYHMETGNFASRDDAFKHAKTIVEENAKLMQAAAVASGEQRFNDDGGDPNKTNEGGARDTGGDEE